MIQVQKINKRKIYWNSKKNKKKEEEIEDANKEEKVARGRKEWLL